jgi:cold shock CspA family protein/ribosome-associated translation inhibitor RaiA
MRLPLDITIHGIGHSDAVEAKIRERAEGLDQFSADISRCEVWVNAPHRHHRKGPLYDLRIRLTVPGEEIVIDHQPEREDVFVAIRESFDAVRRQLEDYERRRRGWIKKHEPAPQAMVSKVFPVEGYGFLRTPEGREIYFHRNSLRDYGFEDVRVGMPVTFTEEEGLEGPQAGAVRILETAAAVSEPTVPASA